jgi:hypothetical protein
MREVVTTTKRDAMTIFSVGCRCSGTKWTSAVVAAAVVVAVAESWACPTGLVLTQTGCTETGFFFNFSSLKKN